MSEKILQGIPNGDKQIVFIGIDWGRKDWTAAMCGRCQTPHRWRKRTPKHCRHCGLDFKFTANEVYSAPTDASTKGDGK